MGTNEDDKMRHFKHFYRNHFETLCYKIKIESFKGQAFRIHHNLNQIREDSLTV